MVTVDKCCICLRLSTGAIILGSFGAFTSLLLVMVIGGFVLSYDNFVAQSYEKEGSDNDDNRRLADFLSTYKNVVLTILATYVVLQCINFVSSLSLVCGTINKRPKLLISWLVSQALLTISWMFVSVLLSDLYITLYAFVWTYFWICIYSLYKKMNLEEYQHQSSFYGMRAV